MTPSLPRLSGQRGPVPAGLLLLLLFSLALALRLLALGRYVTPDELIWVYRSVLFREALLHGRFAETLVAGHPGVTTTWLGTLAISLQLWLHPADAEAYTWITHLAALTPENVAAFQHLNIYLSGGRTAVAIVNSLGVVTVYALAARIFNRQVALLAAVLLALDPFVAGLSGLLHVDGLLTTGTTLSLLALALAAGYGREKLSFGRRLAWTAVSGTCAALAVLSKTPGLLLVPVAVLVLASGLLIGSDRPASQRWHDVILLGIAWLGSFAVVLFACFPALWASPSAVLSTVSGNTGRHLEEALRPTFFMGDVAFDHGMAFYLVTILWRMTPLVLVGLMLLGAILLRGQTRAPLNLPALLLMGGWLLVFVAMITVAAKKFDRYALPLFPVLILLAAVGLVYQRQAWSGRQTAVRGILIIAAVLQGIMLVFSVPYLLSSYNLLLGGPYTAQRLLPIGWGESISASGRWLADQPGAEQETAISGIAPSLAPFFPGETLVAEQERPEAADNLIMTITGRQENPEATEAATTDFELRHTARYGLLDGAWVYENPAPQRELPQITFLETAPQFAAQMRLLGQELRALDGDARYTAVWERLAEQSRPVVKLTLRDGQGEIWNESEMPLLNETAFYPPDWQADERPQISYLLKLPPTVPPGNYVLEMSLLDGSDGSQLPVTMDGGTFGGVVYEAGTVEVQTPLEEINPGALGMTAVIDQVWAGGALRLLGKGTVPQRAPAGGTLPLELYWQALQALPPGLQISLQLGDEAPAMMPLSRFDSGRWEAGRTILEKYRLPLAPDLVGGKYPLRLQLLDGTGQPLRGDSIELGDIQVDTITRLFELPQDIAVPLAIRFDEGITLRGISPDSPAGKAGDSLPLTLYWQGTGQTAVPLTAFVHLLNTNGDIVAQADRWPGGLPSDVWSAGQVIVDDYALTLPEDLAAGDYSLGVGLYNAQNGQRVTVEDAQGDLDDANRVILPVTVVINEGP